MDKEFRDTCKLLQKRYRKIMGENTAQASTSFNSEILHQAKHLLETEKESMLTDRDIENLRQNSVAKYAKEIETYLKPKPKRKTLCNSNDLNWLDDNLWTVPNPRRKSIYTFNRDKCIEKSIDKVIDLNKEKKNEDIKKNDNNNGSVVTIHTTESNWKSSEQSVKESESETTEYEKIYKDILTNLPTHEKEQVSASKKSTEVTNEKDLQKPVNVENKEAVINIKEPEKFSENKEVKINEIVDEVQNKKNIFSDLFVTTTVLNNTKECLEVKKMNLENSDGLLNTEISETQKNDEKPENIETQLEIKTTKNENDPLKSKDELKSKIDNFLQNVSKYKAQNSKSAVTLSTKNQTADRKSKSSINLSNSNLIDDMKSFQNRYKAQKDIIELQKQKLLEQNKLIEELKLKKISEEAAKSLENCKNIYQDTIKSSTKFKYKAKLIKEDVKTEDKDVEFSVSLSFQKAPKIVQVMEERAKEREERRLLIKERKRLIEEEKKRQAEELIKRKEQEEREEKQKRLDALKEKRDYERQMQLQRKLEKKREMELNRKAFLHYRKKLLEHGLKSLKDVMEQKIIQEEIAVKLYEFNITLKYFRNWLNSTREMVNRNITKADTFWNNTLLRKVMGKWLEHHLDIVRKMQVAQDFYEMKLQTRVFSAFHHLICIYHMEFKENETKAKKHYQRQLLFQYFDRWQSLPAIMKIERCKNERRRKWRLKVAEILPDYNPTQDE